MTCVACHCDRRAALRRSDRQPGSLASHGHVHPARYYTLKIAQLHTTEATASHDELCARRRVQQWKGSMARTWQISTPHERSKRTNAKPHCMKKTCAQTTGVTISPWSWGRRHPSCLPLFSQLRHAPKQPTMCIAQPTTKPDIHAPTTHMNLKKTTKWMHTAGVFVAVQHLTQMSARVVHHK